MRSKSITIEKPESPITSTVIDSLIGDPFFLDRSQTWWFPSFPFLFGAARNVLMQTKTGLKMKGITYREEEISEYAAPVLQRLETCLFLDRDKHERQLRTSASGETYK